MKGTREASKHIPLKTLIEIRMNQYRSKHNEHDYDPESVDDAINALMDKEARRMEHVWIKRINSARQRSKK